MHQRRDTARCPKTPHAGQGVHVGLFLHRVQRAPPVRAASQEGRFRGPLSPGLPSPWSGSGAGVSTRFQILSGAQAGSRGPTDVEKPLCLRAGGGRRGQRGPRALAHSCRRWLSVAGGSCEWPEAVGCLSSYHSVPHHRGLSAWSRHPLCEPQPCPSPPPRARPLLGLALWSCEGLPPALLELPRCGRGPRSSITSVKRTSRPCPCVPQDPVWRVWAGVLSR